MLLLLLRFLTAAHVDGSLPRSLCSRNRVLPVEAPRRLSLLVLQIAFFPCRSCQSQVGTVRSLGCVLDHTPLRETSINICSLGSTPFIVRNSELSDRSWPCSAGTISQQLPKLKLRRNRVQIKGCSPNAAAHCPSTGEKQWVSTFAPPFVVLFPGG